MKGNLSKKKGFLGDITEGNLDYIASKLNTEYGERLTDTEASVLNITQTIIPDLKNELTEYTDDMVDEAYKGIEDLETTVKGKEDVSNKIMVADDDGTYWSAAMTDMKTYQTIEEHIVQDLNEPREDRIPSVKAVSEAIKGIKPDIDLSDYYTKEEVDAKKEDKSNKLNIDFINSTGLSPDYYTDTQYLGAQTNMILLQSKESTANKVSSLDVAGDDEELYLNLRGTKDAFAAISTEIEIVNANIRDTCATKEEVGDIAEATAAIIALQNKYIGGETV